ncbi:ImmA/IrrE family metallo-endopeptidase [Agromyces archimandritae]|uniref:ImmA/IrrE family metallo-endopeptidase n=1 Tax=Agromyces archimandritae TaxID=2781962 RepID=A0A975IPP4_9MICO|nr:ImmA/IrrE family metallo-endopeptidase [Agromyces archimandritae]QTX05810.1 ImmA/IrrE family metallo-endopeptidase [Agromyces archimandritae]
MAATLDYAVPTGEFIAEWMDDAGINAAELSRRLGVTPKHVSELLSGKAPLSHALALALERVTGVPARIWNLYESGYRDALAREATTKDLEAQYEAAKAFPLGYLRKWRLIDAPARDHASTVRQLLEFLRVASLEAFETSWSRGNVAYRRSAVGREKAEALATWLVLAERQLDGLRDIPSFDRQGLTELLPRLRSMTRENPDVAIEQAIEALESVGVVLRLVPAVPGLGLHGATRWVDGRPVIQLSLLWKTDDQLWFTLFHELGHVLLHSERSLFVAGAGAGVDGETEAEAEADRFAAETLIPTGYEDRLPRTRDVSAIESLAAELGIAPSIVLGRAQRLTLDYAWGQALRHRLEFTPPEA